MLIITLYAEQKKKKKTQIYRTVFWTLWEKARVGCFKRTASIYVLFYLFYNYGFGRKALLPRGMWNLSGPGIEPMSHASACGFLTNGPAGKS